MATKASGVTLGALGKITNGERLRYRASKEVELVVGASDLCDANPYQHHLHLYSLQTTDRLNLDVPRNVATVFDLHVGGMDVAVPREVYLEGAIWAKDIPSYTFWEDTPGQIVLLEHLIRCRC